MPIQADRSHRIALALIGVLACVVMLPALDNDFAFDDPSIILDNQLVASPSALHRIFISPYWSSSREAHDLYRPFTIASFWLNYRISGPDPFSFHLVNVLLHALVSVMVAVTLERRFGSRAAALCAAALFAVHPVHADAVASAVGRAELLAAAGALGAWLLRERRASSCILYAFGMLSKENAIVAPALMLIEDLVRRRRPEWKRQYLPLLAVALGFLALRTFVLGGGRIEAVEGPLHGVAAGTRILTAVSTFAHYLLLMLFPARLTPHYWYDRVPLQTSLLSPGFLAGAACLVLFMGAAWWLRRREPAISAGLLIYMCALLPASNLILPTGILMAERLLYLPSVGFCLAAGALIASGSWSNRRQRAARLVVLCALTAILSVRTWRAAESWKDDTTIASVAVAVAPASGPARYFLGAAHLNARRWSDAERELRWSLELLPGGTPDSALAHAGLGTTLHAQGRLDEAEGEYRAALRDLPGSGRTHFNIGVTLEALGRLPEAAASYDQARRLNPSDAQSLNNLGRVLLELGRTDEAVTVLREAVALKPGEAIPAGNLAAGLLAQGDLDEAERVAMDVLSRSPDNPAARRIVEQIRQRHTDPTQ